MRYVLINKDMPSESIDILNKYGKVVKTTENKNLLEGLRAHPDMLVHVLPNKDIVCDRDNFSYYKEIFKDRNVIPTSKPLEKKYPGDVALNCFTFKNYFIHNINYTDEKILSYYKNNGYNIICVRQGYSKCSTLVTCDFLVTSDDGIYSSLKDTLPIYKINFKDIKLKNFDYGFIGGSSGSLSREVFLTGELGDYDSKSALEEILKKYDYKLNVLSSNPIEDYGSILFV